MKKFYQTTRHEAHQGGFRILLDDKPLNTPAKNPLIVPTTSMAQAIAQEWRMQGEEIDKHNLPYTAYASLALDVVCQRREELLEELLGYGETDLLFYRDDAEEALQQTQQKQWQPWIIRAQQAYGTHYHLAAGIMPVTQPAENNARHREQLTGYDDWQLALIAVVTKLTTSLLLTLAFMEKALDAEEIFTLSQLEEAYNRTRWGEDTEAQTRTANIRKELQHAQAWRDMISPVSANASAGTSVTET
jgi:chaperone required for assembly of F1-ATPase